MKEQEKQIEEMAKEICPIYIDPTYEDCEYCKKSSNGNCDSLEKLKKFIKNYFPKNSVVLSREELEEKYEPSEKFMAVVRELEDLKQNLEDKVLLSKEEVEGLRQEIITLSQELVNSRKETAEKFYKKVRKLLKKVDIIVDGDEGLVGYEESAVDKGLTELAKQFGVEIKE